MTDSEKQQAVEDFVRSEVYTCQSMLVEELLNKEIFSFDDIQNLYKLFDGKLIHPNTCYSCKLTFDSLDSETGECQDCFEENQTAQDIFEWWVVSDWLANKLKEQGEPIIDNDFGTWWGRTCSGQAIYMDGVINDIYEGFKE